MKTLFLLLSLLLPCSALGEEVRIVKCTNGTAAVQEYRGIEMDCPNGLDSCRRVEYWRTLPSAPGCYPLETARRLRDEEIAWRNRPPAPTVKEPIEVIE